MMFPSKPWPELGWFERAACCVFVVLTNLRQEWRCRRGRHCGMEPGGHCTFCGEKICRGRGDRWPEGCMAVWGEL